MWLPLALVAALLTSFLPVINKRLLTDADVAVVAWGVNAFSLPLLGVATVLLGPVPQVDSVFWLGIFASALLNLVATLMSTSALKLGEASLVTPFLTFNPAFTLLIAAVTLGEWPSVLGASGVLLIVLGGYAFNIEEQREGWMEPLKALVRDKAIFLAILASFVWGLTPITEKLAIQHSDPENAPLVAFGSTALMALFLSPYVLIRSKRPLAQIRSHPTGFGTAATIAGIAPVFGFTAIKLGLVGYVTAIFKLSAVASVVWASIILRETGVRQRLAGSSLMLLGALVITLG